MGGCRVATDTGPWSPRYFLSRGRGLDVGPLKLPLGTPEAVATCCDHWGPLALAIGVLNALNKLLKAWIQTWHDALDRTT